MNTVEEYAPADRVCSFNCLGEVNLKDSRVGNNFVKNSFTKVIPNPNNSYVVLFGRNVNKDYCLLSKQRIFFQKCRRNYMIIHQGGLKTGSRIFGARVTAVQNRNYGLLRREICEFMNFIHNYLAAHGSWCTLNSTKLLLNTSKNLCSFWRLLQDISCLPDSIVYSGSAVENKCHNAGFHLLHLHLDLLWYRLNILYWLERLNACDEVHSISFDVNEEIKLYTQSLVQDLFILSTSRFEKLTPIEIKRKTPFPCACFKEIWLLIQIFIDRHKTISSQNEFWTHINNFCSRLFDPATSNSLKKLNLNKKSCSNPVLFSLWITVHLGHLYWYSEKGEYIGSSCKRMVTNYALLDKILKLLLTGDVISEAQLRSCIPFITELIINLWPPQREPIFKLWEHFHQRLNSCFFLPGASSVSVAVHCNSGAEILRQVRSIVDSAESSGLYPENSFNLFLRLLGLFLKKYPLQWSGIKGRVFSKFSTAKMLTLKEMGIFNFTILFLSMALTDHTKEVGDKMQILLNQAISVSVDLERRLMIWKAHLALLQLYVEKEMDIAEASKFLMEDVNQKSNCKDSEAVALFNTFAKGLKDVISSSKTLDYSEYKLIGSWINSYLKLTPEPAFLLDTLSEVMTKILSLSRSVGMIEYNASESHLTKMYLSICKHLLPYIKEKFAISDPSNSCIQIADLAVNITLLTLNRTNVGVAGTSVPHLFECFAINANPVNAKLSVRYVCVLLQEEGMLSELMDTYDNYELLIIQTWIRSSVYLFENDSQEDLSKLTQIVCKIPSFVALCQEAALDIKTQTKPVDSFIFVLGQLFSKKNSLEERSAFRELCLLYLTPMVKSFERMLRNKDVNDKILYRIYEVAALLIMQCGPIIYSKTQPYCIFNSLVNSLLLPVAMFKPGVEIPSSMLYAIWRTFPLFVKGIVKLNTISENSLSSVIKNLIIRYFPRLVGKSFLNFQECNKSSPLYKHPLSLCFDDEDSDSDKEVPKNILDTISQSFLRVGDTQCMNALMFLLEILQEKRFDDTMVKLFIDISLARVLDVIVLGDSTLLMVKRQAVHLLKEILNNKINNNISLGEDFWAILWTVIQRHIVLHTVSVMSLLCKMCEIAPYFMMGRLQHIKNLITSPSVFHRSNVVKTVRLGVENMEKLLSLSK